MFFRPQTCQNLHKIRISGLIGPYFGVSYFGVGWSICFGFGFPGRYDFLKMSDNNISSNFGGCHFLKNCYFLIIFLHSMNLAEDSENVS